MGDTRMIQLCATCQPKAEPFADRMEAMKRKLAAALESGDLLDEQSLRDAEKLARSFDAILCPECRKLGPRLPGPDESPFSEPEA